MEIRDEAHLNLALEYLTRVDRKREYQRSLLRFAKDAWKQFEPGRKLVWNWHMTLICAFLEAFYQREFNNGIINIPFRLSKSTLVSVIYPAWVWCQEEDLDGDPIESWQGGVGHKFLTLSHKETLALRDASNTKLIIESAWYKEYFPHVQLDKKQNEKGFFTLKGGGYRISMGSKAGVTGFGADSIQYDDPHDVDKAHSDLERTSVTDAYDRKIANRLNDQSRGGKLIIMQRIHELDLTGHVLDTDGTYHPKDNPYGWLQLRLPNRFEEDSKDEGRSNPAAEFGFVDPRKEEGDLIDPIRMPLVITEGHERRLGEYGASGQLQQRPSPGEGGILKKKWWQKWPEDKPLPQIEHFFPSWDTAFGESDMKENAYSCYTLWGIFWDDNTLRHNIMLCGAWWDRVDYPDLREKAIALQKERSPDCHLIEKKASGISLVQDLRRKRIPVRRYDPDKDKISRAYAVQGILQYGQVWYPNRAWARKVIRHIGSFPVGAPPCKDLTDTMTQALLYLRNGWWISHPDDHWRNETESQPREAAYG